MNGKLLIILLCFTALLVSCTTKYAKPYSSKKCVRMLREQYGVEMKLINKEIVKKPPYASYVYTVQDKDGVTFTALAGVKMDRHIPIIQRKMSDNYRKAIMLHKRTEALQIADKYGLWLQPMDSLNQLPDDNIYLSDIEQMEATAYLYFDLKQCYGFQLRKDVIGGSDYIIPSLRIYHLFYDEENKLKARFLCDLDYEGYDTDLKRSPYLRNPATLWRHLKFYWDNPSMGIYDAPEEKATAGSPAKDTTLLPSHRAVLDNNDKN